MKRFILLLSLLLLIMLSACGQTETEAEVEQQTEEPVAEEVFEEPAEELAEEAVELEHVITGVYDANYQNAFPVTMALYPDGTGYFTSLTTDADLSQASYECGEDGAFTFYVDGETITGTFSLEENTVTFPYLHDNELVFTKSSDDWEALLAKYPDIVFESALEESLWAKTLDNINVRSDAGTDYEKIDKIMAGTIVELLDVTEAGGYAWYKIGDGRWIADDGTWLDICSAEEYEAGYFDAVELTEEDALQMAKEHATWIDEYVAEKYPGGNSGWECSVTSCEYDYENQETGEVFTIPEGSFAGYCYESGETAAWQIYEFAIVLKDNEYVIWDLFREDRDVPDYEALAAEACAEELNAIFDDYSTAVWYLASYKDGEYSKPLEYGEMYKWVYYNDDNKYLLIYPEAGRAEMESYSSEQGCNVYEWVLE